MVLFYGQPDLYSTGLDGKTLETDVRKQRKTDVHTLLSYCHGSYCMERTVSFRLLYNMCAKTGIPFISIFNSHNAIALDIEGKKFMIDLGGLVGPSM